MSMRKALLSTTAAVTLAAAAQLSASPAEAAPSLVEITSGAFTAGAGLITFSEPGFPVGTNNPTYTPAEYGGSAASPTVNFGGYFVGQSLGSTDPSACPSGAAVSGCVLGSPTGGTLALDPGSPATFITNDSAMPTSPILSGSPTYNGPISILFSTPQAGVGLIGGYFNSVCSTGITAFSTTGQNLGTVCNSTTGDEFLGLVTSDGSDDIAGLQFHLVGDEPAGFDIDNLEFGTTSQVTVPTAVPEPGSLCLLLAGLGGFAALTVRARRRSQT